MVTPWSSGIPMRSWRKARSFRRVERNFRASNVTEIGNHELVELHHRLNAEVLDLKQGLDAIEEHAREDLGMVKEGETFYQIVE